ncbi:hypothetical protein AALP_AA3G067000 [Arabis alpina]|uniref:RRM domain-containing protein n=1 Tax=Arabis alpina TaxID=50452 RepID=A0A087H7H7_ARAAL|nr:hypothetical protein AALP_AA3G067000 [Arabis alpina]
MSQNHNNLVDHKYTKIFVGGLPWTTTTDDLRNLFQQFGDVLDANVVYEGYHPNRRSKGYGFVTFRDAESAARALVNPCPIIDGRIANVNLAYLYAKNNNNPNQINNNGLLHQAGPSNQYQAGPSHQYQNGPINQALPCQYQLVPQFTPFYWGPNYGQFPPMVNVPYSPYYNPMTYLPHPYVPTFETHQKWYQIVKAPGERVRISAAKSSLNPIQEVSEETNQEVVTTDIDTEPESDVSDQQENAMVQEEEILTGQGMELEEDVLDRVEIVSEVTYQNEMVREENEMVREEAPQAIGFVHEMNCGCTSCTSQENEIDQDA